MAKAAKKTGKAKQPKQVTRYTHDSATDPVTPETGHTSLIAEEQIVTLPMDNGWSTAIEVGTLGDEKTPIIVDMDPAVDPVLFWAGKRNLREVPLLPLQRNEIVTESRIGRIIERAREKANSKQEGAEQVSLPFAGLEKEFRETEKEKRVEFYTHEEGWKNKLICGDSLEVMESLIHHEGLSGKVQMIYIDPPYGIDYNSNFQQRIDSTRNDQKDLGDDVLTVRAFRDTWLLGIHSYLQYLYERLYVARELLTESGSVFVQINDTQLGMVRGVLDEVFGRANFCSMVTFKTVTSQSSSLIPSVSDYLLWYSKSREAVKYRKLYRERNPSEEMSGEFSHYEMPNGSVQKVSKENIRDPGTLPQGARLFRTNSTVSGDYSETLTVEIDFGGVRKHPGADRHWKTTVKGMLRLYHVGRLLLDKGPTRMFKQYLDDQPVVELINNWTDLRGEQNRSYSTQTHERVVSRCLLMTTDPGDLVFDPTCGSGTTAFTSEKYGRRWVTCDTSRVAVNVARKRLLSGVFEQYKTRGPGPSSGFEYATVKKLGLEVLARDLEAEEIDLVDHPVVDTGAARVCGPFEVMSLGRYSLSDWEGYLAKGDGQAEGLQNYVKVIAQLYRKNAWLQDSGGYIQAVVDSEDGAIGLSVGPISGRVTARQLYDAVNEAGDAGIKEVHLLGWAFEANVGEVKSKLESDTGIRAQLVMIRPDTLAEGLKVTTPELLFSPLALPEIQVESNEGKVTVVLQGVAMFDRKSRVTEYKAADSGYVSAWYLDQDYDGDCFVDCQMFFDFKKKPSIEKTLGIEVDPEEWKLRLESDPFELGTYERIAVKVVDVYGNESTVVRNIG